MTLRSVARDIGAHMEPLGIGLRAGPAGRESSSHPGRGRGRRRRAQVTGTRESRRKDPQTPMLEVLYVEMFAPQRRLPRKCREHNENASTSTDSRSRNKSAPHLCCKVVAKFLGARSHSSATSRAGEARLGNGAHSMGPRSTCPASAVRVAAKSDARSSQCSLALEPLSVFPCENLRSLPRALSRALSQVS